MKIIRNREQVVAAIQKAGHPITSAEIFQSCDCFLDRKDCSELLHQMEVNRELETHKARGTPWAFFGTPGMKLHAAPVPPVLPNVDPVEKVRAAKAAAACDLVHVSPPPNAAELRTATLMRATEKVKRPGRKARVAGHLAEYMRNIEYPVAVSQVSEDIGFSINSIWKLLREGVDNGTVTKFGTGSKTTYALTDSAAAKKGRNPVSNAGRLLATAQAVATTMPHVAEREPITTPDMNAINQQLTRVAQPSELEETFTFLQTYLNEIEYRGYLRGNLILLSMRGQPSDMQRLQTFGKAMAGMV